MRIITTCRQCLHVEQWLVDKDRSRNLKQDLLTWQGITGGNNYTCRAGCSEERTIHTRKAVPDGTLSVDMKELITATCKECSNTIVGKKGKPMFKTIIAICQNCKRHTRQYATIIPNGTLYVSKDQQQ